VQFLVVYIREAHAVDGAWPITEPGLPVIEEPLSLEERREVAAECVVKLALEPMPAVVDDISDAANLAYEAWPDRLFLVDAEGHIAFRSGPGPFGFEPKALEDAIRRELGLPVSGSAPPSAP
jgi:hypothetical protein